MRRTSPAPQARCGQGPAHSRHPASQRRYGNRACDHFNASGREGRPLFSARSPRQFRPAADEQPSAALSTRRSRSSRRRPPCGARRGASGSRSGSPAGHRVGPRGQLGVRRDRPESGRAQPVERRRAHRAAEPALRCIRPARSGPRRYRRPLRASARSAPPRDTSRSAPGDSARSHHLSFSCRCARGLRLLGGSGLEGMQVARLLG